ncbi:MAG: hypothetical protein Q9223_003366 [Gallowayella weberi]
MAAHADDLRSLLAMSLKATIPDARVLTADVSKSSSDPGRSKLIKGILFSRRFIISYQVVLLALLMVFTIRNWTHRIRSQIRQRRRQNLSIFETRPGGYNKTSAKTDFTVTEDSVKGVSSSSSTIQGICSPSRGPIKDGESEQTPLLRPSRASSFRPKGLQLRRKIRAFLIYQPRPIPLVNKALPSNGTTLFVLALLGLQVFYILYQMPLSIPMLFVFADRTSLLFVANLPILYLFAAKNQPIKLLTGYSYESLNIFHRRLGEVMCVLALLHSVGMVGVWYTILRPVGFSLARFLLSKIILLGLGALVAYEMIYFTSLGSFRQRWYELFLFLHVSLQAAALVLLWFHHHGSRPYVGAALVIFLVDRLFYRMGLKLESSQASVEVAKDSDTVILRTKVSLAQKHRYLRNLIGQDISKGWKATEHIFLTVPVLSCKHIVQAHPFTIASKAPQAGDSDAELKLIIRAQDGFSGDLLRYARRQNSVKVRLDGPYGSQNALHLLQQSDLSIVVAGGSGIAILLIWVIRNDTHTSWVGPSEFQNLRNIGIEVIIPPPTAENGKPDVPSMIYSWVSSGASPVTSGDTKIGVVCSGPDGMNRAVRNICNRLLAQGHDIDVEVEKFGW